MRLIGFISTIFYFCIAHELKRIVHVFCINFSNAGNLKTILQCSDFFGTHPPCGIYTSKPKRKGSRIDMLYVGKKCPFMKAVYRKSHFCTDTILS